MILTALEAPARAQAPIPDGAEGDTTRALHLLRRATYGVRPQDLAGALDLGLEAWLERQLSPERIDDSELEERLTTFPAAEMSVSELYAAYPPPRVARARLGKPDSVSRDEMRRMRRELGIQSPNRILFDLAGAKLVRAVDSERQLEEVMTDFWFNHFNVFFAKGPDRWFVGDYEREAIRPNVFGEFEDMLIATASHPAMLVYLDNWQSQVPDSLNPRAARQQRARTRFQNMSAREREVVLRMRGVPEEQIARIEDAMKRQTGRQRGLNENYARELLELHTLGVDGGYTQEDVIEVARAFTGWTMQLPGRSGGRDRASRMVSDGNASAGQFVFRPEWHDPGEKTVLGRELSAGRGIEDGLDVLRMLAVHPSTARHVVTKLAGAFVADDPPPALVDELAAVFLETRGDLREVTRALFTSEHFYDPENIGAKLKTPFELVASALRVTGAEFGPSRGLAEQLRALDQIPYMSSPPTGYPAESEEWASGAALLQRMNLGLAMATGGIQNVRVPGSLSRQSVDRMLADLLPGAETAALQEVIQTEIRSDFAGLEGALAELRRGAGPNELALGLALGSPEFQRRTDGSSSSRERWASWPSVCPPLF
jgi:uncharacterized protein (DUF1800 family)